MRCRTVLLAAALGVITARNPVHGALCLVLTFFTSAVLWLLLEAEFLAIVLVLVYVGAVMVLFLFVVMMLDINIETLREGFTRYAPVGRHRRRRHRAGAGLRRLVPQSRACRWAGSPVPRDAAVFQHRASWARCSTPSTCIPFELAAVLLLVAIVAAIVLTMRHRQGLKVQDIVGAGGGAARGPGAHREDEVGGRMMITLQHYLTLSALLFAISVAGIFINRKNVILLLMCIELLLLAANFNFVAFSRYLGNLDGQVFVFFVLTVAAAESAIGLAILVVLFRSRRSINVQDLDVLKG